MFLCQKYHKSKSYEKIQLMTLVIYAPKSHWMSANRLKLNKEKTELLWVGSRYNLSALSALEGCGPALLLDADTVEAKDHVRVLGVTFSADLTLDRHASNISAACFYRLRQLRRVRRPLDSGSAATRPRPRDVAH